MTASNEPATAEIPAAEARERPSHGLGRLARRWALYLVVGAAMVALMVFFASMLMRSGLDLQRLQQQAGTLRLVGAAVQSVLVGLVAIGWPRLVDAGVRRGLVPAAERAPVLALRAKVVAFLVAYLLLVAIGPANLVAVVMFLRF